MTRKIGNRASQRRTTARHDELLRRPRRRFQFWSGDVPSSGHGIFIGCVGANIGASSSAVQMGLASWLGRASSHDLTGGK